MPGGQTGVRAAIGTTARERRSRSLGARRVGEAVGGRRIEEAVVEEADVQRPSEMGKHGAQPPAVHDPTGTIAELVADACELSSQSRPARTGRTFLAKKRLVMGNNVVKLTECTLSLDG